MPIPSTEWTQQAACRGTDTDLFFPAKGEPTTAAKEICWRCPVAGECLDAAMRDGERFGVWGGLSELERRALRRRRRREGRTIDDPLAPFHGTLGGYINHACRCSGCSAANTTYRRMQREARAAG